jgi:hypothetical protein
MSGASWFALGFLVACLLATFGLLLWQVESYCRRLDRNERTWP